MEYSCKVWCKPCGHRLTLRLHSKLSWRLRQEGEMEQYLEDKKASQKRPVATFQRQDKKKVAYQTPQRPAVTGSSQVPSVRSPGVKKECPHCGKVHGGTECWMITGKCLKCGSSDHKIKDCPRLQQGVQRGAPAPAAVVAAAPATGRPGRPRAPARVFALAREDAEQVEYVTEVLAEGSYWRPHGWTPMLIQRPHRWTPILKPTSMDMDVKISDMHASRARIPGTSNPNHWGAIPNGLKAFTSTPA
ncbi:hypothetical protein Taro_043012 [Colocasia esculenta]|uniref:CCHC-type domain-containing protein n=1 Tax=Colocasia esculenta TaxID=4460 RepID=A0A843WXY9_COLES|nr:hypothetical protein [Colocasia esculenta]